MRTQLRRQAAAHTDHLRDVLKIQEQELKVEFEQVREERPPGWGAERTLRRTRTILPGWGGKPCSSTPAPPGFVHACFNSLC